MARNFQFKITRNSFRTTEDILPDTLQEDFLEMKYNSTAKHDFEHMPLIKFRAKYTHIYKDVGNVALQTLLPFSSTYLCESGFSTLLNVKTNVEAN